MKNTILSLNVAGKPFESLFDKASRDMRKGRWTERGGGIQQGA